VAYSLPILFCRQIQVFAGLEENRVPFRASQEIRSRCITADKEDIDIDAISHDVFDRRTEQPAPPLWGTRLTEHNLDGIVRMRIGEDLYTLVVACERHRLCA
jgi:hypothetical protein